MALRKRLVLEIHNINTVNSLSFTEIINLEMHIVKTMLCQKKSMSLYLVSINSFYVRYNISYLLPNGTQQAVELSPAFKH